MTPERIEWLILESEVLTSWVQQARADSRALVAQARQARSRRSALRQIPGSPPGSGPAPCPRGQG